MAGRKKSYPDADEKIIGMIEGLAKHGCPLKTIAAEFNISLSSLNNWRKEDPRIDEAYKSGRGKGSNELLTTAYKQAKAGNTTMLIFLMKTRLHMSERPVIDLSSNKLNKIIDIIINTVKDPDELKRIEMQMRKEIDTSDDE